MSDGLIEWSPSRLFHVDPLTRPGSLPVLRDTGEAISLSLNQAFFAAQNPRWTVPVLRDTVRHSPIDFASVVTRAVLHIY
jgi:hypothetical protein